jgi:FlaG/FlaF family flagellin (archaellin)
MDHKMKLILVTIGLLATVSVFVLPSTSMVALAQGDNQTSQGVRDQAQEKLTQLLQRFNGAIRDAGANLTLGDGDLAAKLQELANSTQFKTISEKFKAAVEELRGNATIDIGQLKAGANLSGLVQRLQELRSQ